MSIARFNNTFVESLDQAADAPDDPFEDDGTVADRLRVQELIYSQDPNGGTGKVRTLHTIDEDAQYFDLYLTTLPFYATTNDRQISSPISGYTLYTAFPNGNTNNCCCYQWGSPAFLTTLFDDFEGFYQLYNDSSSENGNEASRFFFFARNSYEIEFYYTDYETGKSAKEATESIKFGASIQDRYWEPDTPANVVFEGWYLDSHLTQPFTFENATMPASSAASGISLNLYAKYRVEDYGATFLEKKNGDTVATEAFSAGSTISDPALYEIGEAYEGLGVFLGWYYTSASGQDVVFHFQTLLNDDIELFGLWQTTGFTVAYDLNGGTGSRPVDNNKYILDNLARVASLSGVYKTVSDTVYLFAGWTLNPDGSGTIYYPGTTVSVYGDMTLYARYVSAISPVTLNYHQNTSSSDAVQTAWVMNMGDDVSLPSASTLGYSYSGYAFLGWSRDPEATEPDSGLTAGGQLTILEDTDLYAVWNRGAFTVVYYQNRSATDERYYEKPALQDEVIIHPAASDLSFTRTGHSFLGWSLSATAAQPDSGMNAGDAMTVVSNVSLYAVWEKSTSGGGTGSTTPPVTEEPESSIDPVPPEIQESENSEESESPETSGNIDSSGTPTEAVHPSRSPDTHDQNNTLVETNDGNYIEIDDAGVPLGVWTPNEDGTDWVFVDIADWDTPLSEYQYSTQNSPQALPKTGSSLPAVLLCIGFALCLVGLLLRKGKNANNGC
ncbi:MAG: InlB B-repeat-containing protein [Oscillospiraceae bacterium]|nr:InlB B-repeat-containing protein [Oscillospiraceae bacterium]